MTVPDTFWPDYLASHEAERTADIAEDAGHPSPPMPHEIGSDNIETVRAAISTWEHRADHVGRIIAELEARLDELEASASSAERREERRDYFSRAL